MQKRFAFPVAVLACFVSGAVVASAQEARPVQENKLTLVILETSDLHSNVMNYDYYKDIPVDGFGLAKAYTVIKDLRKQYPDAVLVDNGDFLQGNPLADVDSKEAPGKDFTPTIISAMNVMHYTVGNLGNHEFNYGLDYLRGAIKHAKFPIVSANVFVNKEQRGTKSHPSSLTSPYLVLPLKIGSETVKVGFVGFAPPQIVNWDRRVLQGKVITQDVVETARHTVTQMKKEGADIVVALSHGGVEEASYKPNDENASFALSRLDGVDAILLGHAHQKFPDAKFKVPAGVDADLVNGRLSGKPAVMPGLWGSHVGMVSLNLEKKSGRWVATGGRGEIFSTEKAEPAPEIVAVAQERHNRVLAEVRAPVGTFQNPVSTYFARVRDSAALQIVNDAQMEYVRAKLKGTPYERLPVLSAAAPFKVGFAGVNDYTEIPAGKVAIKHISDLYLFPNTIAAVRVNGSQLKEWLEESGRNFNTIDAHATGDVEIINPAWKGYNFDVIDGVNYAYDLTQQPGARVKNLMFAGKPVTPDMEFVVATNNYRAFGESFRGVESKRVVYSDTHENREIIIDYVKAHKNLEARADDNWRLLPVPGFKGLLIFKTAPKSESAAFLPSFAQKRSQESQTQMITYALDLSR